MYDWSTGIGLIGRDITVEKQTERNLAIAKEQAERALESEVKYNKAKSDFLSKVSHELRTPLNAIIGFTNIAEMADNKKDIVRCFTKIKDSSEHLLWLVNDIVDMTSIDTGTFNFLLKPFSFSAVMQSVIEDVSRKAKEKNQEFISYVDSNIQDHLISDERRIKQILQHLLYNAVKFTQKNGIIELSAASIENNGRICVIRFEIKDNGPGISKEMQDHLGDMFEQEDNSITRKFGGMGLGLSLTKRIVEMMNGRISVESQEGKGSHFICEVPLELAPNNIVNVNNKSLDENDSHPFSLSGKNVLVVDDVELNRDILFCMLEDTGAVLEGAKDGEEAVKKSAEKKYDLILMDLHMPLMDGFAAAKNIRISLTPWAKTVPIISVSAESSVDLHWKCLDAGINEHLAKPIEMEALFGIISKWVK
jgi:CheY-like chemotaxis protein/nitrogen-specific signal transduction histidine kinase